MKKIIDKKRRKIESKDLDLAPMLSLMVSIIPVLLATSVILKIRIFDSSVFPASDKVMQSDGANENPIAHLEIEDVNEIKLVLKQNDAKLYETTTSLAKLHGTLKVLKTKYPNMKSLKIESSPEISYKEIIKVFDMAKSPLDEKISNGETIFEDVTLEDIFKG